MKSIADSSYLIALLNRRDRDHTAVAEVAASLRIAPWLVTPCLTEICYVLHSRLGMGAPQRFLESLADPRTGLQLLDPHLSDYVRAARLIGQYGDSGLDFVDALVIAVAERLDIRTVLTLDRRHFGIVRPSHCTALTLLPEVGG